MTNDMNAFELSDEQLEEITGAGSGLVNISNQIGVNVNLQLNNVTAPTVGVAVGTGLNLKGANVNLGNLGNLGNTNTNK